MASLPEYVDPTDVTGVNERIRAWAADGEWVRPVAIRRVVIAEDALEALVETVRWLSTGGRTMLVVDRTPMGRGGDDLKALLEDKLAGAVSLLVRRLPDDESRHFNASLEWAQRLASEAESCATIVSVGSGSVTDVAKYARQLLSDDDASRSVPLISFPTAASVTAYTSALAVLTVDGVKRTLPARAPEAVICDLRTLADAPKTMSLAGFGDMMARSVAYGDWFLASQLGMDDGFSEIPGRFLEHGERAIIARAEQVAGTDIDGLRCLIEGLLLAGMAMSVIGQTAPISGWEHAMSHFLDMTAAIDGRRPALHGAQVGVTTVVAARAYERSWADLDLDRVLRDVDVAWHRRLVEQEFLPFDEAGRLAAEIWNDLQEKLACWNRSADVRRGFVKRKRAGEYDAFIRANVRSSEEIVDALQRATAPRRFGDLNEPVSAETARAAVAHSHIIRARFTLGDLLMQAGRLSDDTIAQILDEPRLAS